MRVLVLGGGGREHALVWKLRQSARVEKIWCVPGNAGIEQDAECIAADASDVAAIMELAGRLKPDLTVVGPEAPLVNGIADAFRAGQSSTEAPHRDESSTEAPHRGNASTEAPYRGSLPIVAPSKEA